MSHGIYDMQGVATVDESLLYKIFGINAELLIDHANGRESCTIADIKAYKGKSKSVSFSQILFEDYKKDKAKIVMLEMVLNGCQEMMRRHVITKNISMFIGYSKDVLPASKGSTRLLSSTNVYGIIKGYASDLFDKLADNSAPIRRLGISFNSVCDESAEGYDFFTDYDEVEREKRAEKTVLSLKDKFGKNAVIRASDLQDGATAIERNKLIGGHNEK